MFTGLKKQIGNYKFRQNLKKVARKKHMVNLQDARSIAIIYLVQDEKIFRMIKNIQKNLSENKREVMVVGYIDRPDIPTYCIVPDSGYYFNQNEIDWLKIPKNDFLKKFIKKEFDILIDLSEDDMFTLKYLSGLSVAKLKVGKYSVFHEKIMDLMIDTKKEESIEYFIDQALYYLRAINNKRVNF